MNINMSTKKTNFILVWPYDPTATLGKPVGVVVWNLKIYFLIPFLDERVEKNKK